MKYNAKYDRWFTKGGLVFRYDKKRDKLIECKQQKSRDGYLRFNGAHSSERPNSNFSHRAIWETFNGPIPEGMEIDHKYGNRSDNRLSELRCVTHKENMANPIFRERRKQLNTPEYREKQRKANIGLSRPSSIFGCKYQEHYNIRVKDNIQLYKTEWRYFKKYGHCSWEVLDEHN